MSQVIQNHVLRVGQTVCVSSQEESKSLHPAGYPGCSALPMKYAYYSTEGWADPSAMVHANARLLPSGALYGAHPLFEHVAAHAQGKGQQHLSSERPTAPYQPKEDDAGTDPEALLVSPTLDISIESLNQLILEIDPTFQPLMCKPAKDAVQPASRGDAAATKIQDPEAIDIKYIEMTPGRATCPELPQGCPGPSDTPFSRSPQHNGFLPHKGGLRGNYSTSGSVVFSSPPTPASPRSGAASPTCSKAPERVAVPLHCAAGQTDSISYGPGALGTSPGFDSLLKPVQVVRAQQRGSWVSLLSTSPGSDTSYVLGSSTHSLPTGDSDAHPTACRSADCPSPASSLGSPYPPSPGIRSHSGEAFGLSPHQPRAACSAKPNASPSQKGQASSCPPSILNSAADIPVLLVNGCLERADAACRLTKAPPASGKQTPAPSCSPDSRLGGLNNALSAPALSCPSDSPLRAGQPTMKFVMDTSKYWFKPSISRDQAIQLLRDKEPGTFVVRDSTSYRGSFGLAMKVPVSPSGSQTVPLTGDESGDLVRHFLIESSAKGVHLKGASEELYFGSLSAFVYQHAITPLALPCKLSIPTRDLADGEDGPDCAAEPALPLLQKAAVCNVLYLNSVSMETLTGAPAIQKAVSSTFEQETLPTPTLVHFRVTEQGVTLTDIQRKVFFRRHYPLAAVRFCGMDPENRKWQKYCKSSRIFGFVAKSQTDSENLCHLFAEYDTVQPASLVIDLLCKLLPGP
ncbi:TENS4 protein, partial [Podilymbus podiceps]|nr:TENS4 protein [Podilymbus podiceps]